MKKVESYFLSRYPQDEYLTFNQAQLILHFCLVTALLSMVYAIVAYFIDFHTSVIVMPLAAVVFLLLAFLLKSLIPHTIIAHFYLIASFVPALVLIHTSGGIYSSILPWLAYIPMAANLMLNRRSAWIWLALCIFSLIGFAIHQHQVSNIDVEYNKQLEIYFYTLVYAGLIFIILMLSMIFQHAKETIQQLLKDKNVEISEIYLELKKKQNEVIVQNKTLRKQKEEISEQKDLLETKNKELVKIHWELEKAIKQLERTQEALAEKEAESRGILQSIYHNHLLAEFDLEGNFIFVSDSFVNTTKVERKELISKNLRRIGDTVQMKGYESLDVFMDNQWPDIVGGQTIHVESIFHLPENKVWTKETFFCVNNIDGNPLKIMVIAQDISTIRRQQLEIEALNEALSSKIAKIAQQNNELQEQRAEIQHINEALQQQKEEVEKINQHLEERVEMRTQDLVERNIQLAEYAYINSHLLRGPLCSILGLVRLLEIESSDKADTQIIAHLKKSSTDLNTVVQKISNAIKEKGSFNRQSLTDN